MWTELPQPHYPIYIIRKGDWLFSLLIVDNEKKDRVTNVVTLEQSRTLTILKGTCERNEWGGLISDYEHKSEHQLKNDLTVEEAQKTALGLCIETVESFIANKRTKINELYKVVEAQSAILIELMEEPCLNEDNGIPTPGLGIN